MSQKISNLWTDSERIWVINALVHQIISGEIPRKRGLRLIDDLTWRPYSYLEMLREEIMFAVGIKESK